MRRLILTLALLLAAAPQWVSAATRAEVNVLEATENIRYLSQRLTKNYLYFYANPLKREIKKEIRKDLEGLVESIRTISMTTSDEDTKNVLEFLTYSKDQIADLVKEKPSKEKAALMLDYSETLLEGANSIAAAHSYQFTPSEKMLMKSKSIDYLVERSAKYYMALGIGLGSEINRKQMADAVTSLEATIGEVESYAYPPTMAESQKKLKSFWHVTKSLFDRQQKLFVSNIMVLSTNELESLASRFVLYHRKNQ
ncbi:hypothetical protein [Nitratifractor sp.]|uniref:hypothetical protein n=1 Tax=Nitratifractor sp. TaxID=2268144 RepID=UPI0025F63E3A|nr:hypothetical protein [Nitratifractor sp.]